MRALNQTERAGRAERNMAELTLNLHVYDSANYVFLSWKIQVGPQYPGHGVVEG